MNRLNRISARQLAASPFGKEPYTNRCLKSCNLETRHTFSGKFLHQQPCMKHLYFKT